MKKRRGELSVFQVECGSTKRPNGEMSSRPGRLRAETSHPASVGRVVKRPFARLAAPRSPKLRKTCLFRWQSTRQQGGHGWLVQEVCWCLGEVEGVQLFLSLTDGAVWLRRRIVSEVEVARTWTDSGVIAEEVKDVALRVFRSVRKGCGDDGEVEGLCG